MKKKKYIFIVVFLCLLVSISAGTFSLVNNVKTVVHEEDIKNNIDIQYHLKYFTLALAKEVNPDYEILSFDGDLLQSEVQSFTQDFYQVLNSIKENMQKDSNLMYCAKNTKSQKEVRHDLEDNHKQILYKEEFTYFDHNNASNSSYFQKEELNLTDFLSYEFVIDDENHLIVGNGYQIPISAIHFQTPEFLTCTYTIPQNFEYIGLLASFIDLWDGFYPMMTLTILFCVFIIGLFILIYPINIIENIQPFMTIKTWKAEFVFSGLIAMCFLLSLVTVAFGSYMMAGQLQGFLCKMNFSLVDAKSILFIFQIVLSITLSFYVSLLWFMVKYVFIYGVIDYVKNQTLCSTIIKFIKRKIEQLTQIDLSKAMNQNILKFVFMNMLIIFLLMTFGSFGYILIILYSCFLYYYIQQNMMKTKKEYQKILEMTEELSQGHFDYEISEELDVFQDLKNQLMQIKIGFEKAVQEETKSQNLKTELITNVSHDLKTPITCIKNYVFLLKDEHLDEIQRHEYIEQIESYTNRLTNLIEDLFEISQVSSGNIQFDFVYLDIISLLEQTLAENEDLLHSKQLKIIKNYSNDNIFVTLDGDKTYRIFENLLTNIGKYALTQSRVYVDVIDNQDDVCIVFRNISECQMNFSADEIVERFVRGDKARHEKGSGIGLAIAKSFTEGQKGKFSIQIDGDLFKVVIHFFKNQVND